MVMRSCPALKGRQAKHSELQAEYSRLQTPRSTPGGLPKALLSRLLLTVMPALALLGLVEGLFVAAPAALAQEELSLEERAKALDKQLICPVCPGETLHQSQAGLARDMRAIIRERLAGGESEEDIVNYFVSVYGESVLAAPPKSGFALTAWVLPPLAMLAGAAALVLAVRSLRGPGAQAPGLSVRLPTRGPA